MLRQTVHEEGVERIGWNSVVRLLVHLDVGALAQPVRWRLAQPEFQECVVLLASLCAIRRRTKLGCSRQELVGSATDGEFDLCANLLGGGSDTLEGSDGIAGEKCGRSTARGHSDSGVAADDCDLLRRLDRQGILLVLEQDDCARSGLAKQCAELWCVGGLFRRIEWDARLDGELDHAEDLGLGNLSSCVNNADPVSRSPSAHARQCPTRTACLPASAVTPARLGRPEDQASRDRGPP